MVAIELAPLLWGKRIAIQLAPLLLGQTVCYSVSSLAVRGKRLAIQLTHLLLLLLVLGARGWLFN